AQFPCCCFFVLFAVPLENLEMSGRARFILYNLSSDAHFSDDTPRHSAFDLPLARSSRTGELGSAPSNRCASTVREKTPEIDRRGPLIVGLSVPPLARLALGAGHRQARDGCDLEGLARATTDPAAGNGAGRGCVAGRRTAPRYERRAA